MSKTLNIPYAELEAPRYVSLPEPYQARLVQVWRMQKLSGGAAHLDTHVAAYLRITESDARATKTAFVERGYCDEDWRPTTLSGPGYRSSNAERQARHRERRKAATGVAGVTSNAAVTQAVTPRNATSNAGVTRGVTSPPNPPPIKSLTLHSHVQTDRSALSERALSIHRNASVTQVEAGSWAIEEDAKLPPPACTEEQKRKVVAVLCRHLDPLGLSDVWARQFRSWAEIYDEPMLLALIPRVVEQVVKHPRTRTGWAGAILQDWAREGVPEGRSEAAAGRVVRSTAAEAEPRHGPPRPLSDHQRKMASLRAVIEEIDDGEAEGEGLGDQGDGQARGAAQLARRA